ncbi:hypothetical protein Aple_084000 [Acrocarpospora pleiomorpha]|uniref:Uncharacterized protein n=1 Tax=Acrocarpospora pleiomorpha TaxID=90975 RepID=A0A5M3Y137_9ACTN|nr:hypothetical protein Aple_084000 [Acrocarpospora pleiomorpha]
MRSGRLSASRLYILSRRHEVSPEQTLTLQLTWRELLQQSLIPRLLAISSLVPLERITIIGTHHLGQAVGQIREYTPSGGNPAWSGDAGTEEERIRSWA